MSMVLTQTELERLTAGCAVDLAIERMQTDDAEIILTIAQHHFWQCLGERAHWPNPEQLS